MTRSFWIRLLVFVGITLGLGWPVASRVTLYPTDELFATVAFSQLGVYLFAWRVSVWAMPLGLLWILPALSVAGLFTRWRVLRETLADPDDASSALPQVLWKNDTVGEVSRPTKYCATA